MKKLSAIIGLCLIGCITQAQPSNGTGSASGSSTENKDQSVKSEKHCDPQEMLAKITETISKRQAEAEKATSNGRTDIAAAIQKIITDLNAMKTAINNKDKAAFKAADEQRQKDREALDALRKSDKANNPKGKSGHNGNGQSGTAQPGTCKPAAKNNTSSGGAGNGICGKNSSSGNL
jgi:hypothetical protein